MAKTIPSAKVAEIILKNPEDFDPESVKAAEEFMSKAAHQTMTSAQAKEVLKAEPDNVAAQEAINVANAGYENTVVPYVTEYTDPAEGGKYKFNWQQYTYRDNPTLATAESLTPEQLKKIEDTRLGSMYDVEDKVNLNKIATDMHFKTANESWTDFMNSNRFAQFENYMSDVAQYQHDKALDKIWNDGSVSNFVTDFTLPVSKAYAREHYNDINGASDMKAALAADAAMNAAMGGSSTIAAALSRGTRPLLRGVVDYTLAPTVSEIGQVAVNDKDLLSAAKDAAIGAGANYATPNVMKALMNRFNYAKNYVQNKPWKTNASNVLDQAVNEAKAAREIQNSSLTKTPKGNLIDVKNKVEYVDPSVAETVTEHPPEGWKYMPNTQAPNKPIQIVTSDNSHIFMPEVNARDFNVTPLSLVMLKRGKLKDAVKSRLQLLDPSKSKLHPNAKPKAMADYFYKTLPEESRTEDMRKLLEEIDQQKLTKFKDRIDKIQSGKISPADWQDDYEITRQAYKYLGIPVRESLANYLGRQTGLGSTYLSNLYGTSPRAKRYYSNLDAMIPLYNAEEAKKQDELNKTANTYRILMKNK